MMGTEFDARYSRFRIGEHDRITIEGTAFRLVQRAPDAWHLGPADGDGLCQTFTFSHLNALSAAGKVRHEVDHFLPPALRAQTRRRALSMALLSRKQRMRVVNRDALVQGFKELHAAGEVVRTEGSIAVNMGRICAAATPYLAENADLAAADREAQARAGTGRRSMGGGISRVITPVHPRTLLKWVRAEAEEGKAGLVDGMARRGNRMSRFSAEEDALLMASVRKSWLNPNRPTQVTTINDVKGAFEENARRLAEGLDPLGIPRRQAVRRCIKSINQFHADVARLGVEEAVKRHRPVGGGLDVSRPLERVEMDEEKIDLMSILARHGLLPLFTEDELEAIGLTNKKARWWACLAIDCRTRIIPGLIVVNDPKSSAALSCLRMAVSDKGEFSDAVGAATPWVQFGGIEQVVTDNGAGFKAHAFTDACNDLGTTLERTIAGRPAMRGTVERVFGSLGQGLLPRLNGRTFSTVVERGEHPAEARACLGPEDLCYVLVRWIVDIYHNTPHEGLGGRTPLEQWEADHREGNFPLHAAPDARSKRLAFGLRLSRMATKAGVTVLGVRYHSPELASHVIRNGPGLVDIRWDEEDIGAVEVCAGEKWLEVPAVNPGLEGVHARVWITARRALQTRAPERKRWDEDVVRKAVEDITALNTHRSLQFRLIDKAISPEYLKTLEEGLYDGFRMTATMPKTRPSDGPGCSIIPRAPDFDGGGEAVRSGDGDGDISVPQSPEIFDDFPAPVPRRSDDEWTFEA